MSHGLWLIGADAPSYEADDLSGKGAEITGGRWNAKGVPAIYTSSTRAHACLETVVLFNAGGLPINRYLVEITVPDRVWDAAVVKDVQTLATGWDAEPPGRVSLDHGVNWLKAKSSALMVVPSVIVAEDSNVVIDPLHPDIAGITARKVRKWLYDPRMTK